MRYFQFIGTQRSGSNLLRVMLNQLPEISAPHPPHILKTFYPLVHQYGDLSKSENFRQLAEDVCSWVNNNPVSWEPYVAVTEDIIKSAKNQDLIGLFVAISKGKALQEEAQIMCCKSMESVSYVDKIELAGLKPIYIHLYRDGRDVSLSFMKAIVGPKHIYSLARKWRQDQIEALAAKSMVPAERFVSLRYEDLIDRPEEVLKNLCEQLGVAYKQEMLQYFEAGESKKTAHAGKMWENLQKPILSSNHQKFLKGLSAEQLIIFESVAGDILTQLGYTLVSNPNDLRTSYTDEEISFFEAENKRLMSEAVSAADPMDLEKRRPQENLLKAILKRAK